MSNSADALGPQEFIVQFDILQMISPDGIATPFKIRISKPQLNDKGDWICTVTDPGHQDQELVVGADSLHVLCLAIKFLRTRLLHLEEKGFRWAFPTDPEEFYFQGYGPLALR